MGAVRLYIIIGTILHELGISMARVAAITVTSDRTATCTSAASDYRDATGDPKQGTAKGAIAAEMDWAVESCVDYMARMMP